MEDQIEGLKLHRLGFGPSVERKYQMAGGGVGPGYENTGGKPLFDPPAAEVQCVDAAIALAANGDAMPWAR